MKRHDRPRPRAQETAGGRASAGLRMIHALVRTARFSARERRPQRQADDSGKIVLDS
jgi:hypothetical protein